MKKRAVKDVAASVRQKLLNNAKSTNRPFQEVLQYFAMERFLYRLAQSPYADKFVLKGALMFTVWGAPATRPTKDIDFLARTENTIAAVVPTSAGAVPGDITTVAGNGTFGSLGDGGPATRLSWGTHVTSPRFPEADS